MKQYKELLPEITLKYKTGEQKKAKIANSQDCYDVLKVFFDQDTIELNESFFALYLNRNNKTIGWLKVSQGGISGTVVDIRLILTTALKCVASAVILAHNHPSGNAKPSQNDINLTNKVIKAGEIMDIRVLDHLIITDKEFYSMADENLI